MQQFGFASKHGSDKSDEVYLCDVQHTVCGKHAVLDSQQNCCSCDAAAGLQRKSCRQLHNPAACTIASPWVSLRLPCVRYVTSCLTVFDCVWPAHHANDDALPSL